MSKSKVFVDRVSSVLAKSGVYDGQREWFHQKVKEVQYWAHNSDEIDEQSSDAEIVAAWHNHNGDCSEKSSPAGWN